jgi:hypothetical protein
MEERQGEEDRDGCCVNGDAHAASVGRHHSSGVLSAAVFAVFLLYDRYPTALELRFVCLSDISTHWVALVAYNLVHINQETSWHHVPSQTLIAPFSDGNAV